MMMEIEFLTESVDNRTQTSSGSGSYAYLRSAPSG